MSEPGPAALGGGICPTGRPVRGWPDGGVHDEAAPKLPICTDTNL